MKPVSQLACANDNLQRPPFGRVGPHDGTLYGTRFPPVYDRSMCQTKVSFVRVLRVRARVSALSLASQSTQNAARFHAPAKSHC
jgi:hypothetical protein